MGGLDESGRRGVDGAEQAFLGIFDPRLDFIILGKLLVSGLDIQPARGLRAQQPGDGRTQAPAGEHGHGIVDVRSALVARLTLGGERGAPGQHHLGQFLPMAFPHAALADQAFLTVEDFLYFTGTCSSQFNTRSMMSR